MRAIIRAARISHPISPNDAAIIAAIASRINIAKKNKRIIAASYAPDMP